MSTTAVVTASTAMNAATTMNAQTATDTPTIERQHGASTATAQPIKIAIMAMGGEGGGVLADWLVDLGEANGWVAQTTSVPGVAQRTGATIYYVELFPAADAERDGAVPVLALMPLPGDVDIVLASELMEAGRGIQRGLVTPDRTTLIASMHRIYSIAEKSAMGDGRVDSAALLAHAAASAQRFVSFDMADLAEQSGSVISAVLFGALAGTGVLPFDRAQFEATIARGGVGVATSLKAFATAYERAAHEPAGGHAEVRMAHEVGGSDGEARVTPELGGSGAQVHAAANGALAAPPASALDGTTDAPPSPSEATRPGAAAASLGFDPAGRSASSRFVEAAAAAPSAAPASRAGMAAAGDRAAAPASRPGTAAAGDRAAAPASRPGTAAAGDRAAAPASRPVEKPTLDPRVRVLLERIDRDFPAGAAAMLREGVRRLVDYQDPAYADLYLDRLASLAAAERELLDETARHLALWMAYEDTARVAQLKTRGARFDRVRAEVRAAPNQVLGIDEYLHPRVQEIAETLPAAIGRLLEKPGWLRRLVERSTRRGRVVTTSSVGGYLLLSTIAAMRRWRRSTTRYAAESAAIDAWLARIVETARAEPALAVEIARCQRLVKGYSDTHERGVRNFETVMAAVARAGGALAPSTLRELRDAALADEHGTRLNAVLARHALA